jgi:UDP-N-acetylglucosamine 2-epimerase (non-hydrolysing)
VDKHLDRLKIVTVVGTRPEIIRLSRVIAKLNDQTDHVLVHTGQNYDYHLNELIFEDLEINKPDVYLGAAGENACETVANIIKKVDEKLEEIQPDAMLVLGDTNSCLAAYPAKRRKIPVFHMEAGNRCFDDRVPEEINRRVIDHLADINMPYSNIAREYLLREGLPPDRIIKTGSPMGEVIYHYQLKANKSDILDRLEIEKYQFYLVSCHREENLDSDNFPKFIDLLWKLSEETYVKTIIMTTHPRTRKKMDEENIDVPPNLRICNPFCYTDYLKLMGTAKTVLSDSGTIAEEASIIGRPMINIRETHERPAGMEVGATIMTGMSWSRIRQAFKVIDSDPHAQAHPDYEINQVSRNVVRIIHSYVDYVRRNVWRS